ncbi:mannose-6-phosphate isomerase 1 [Selaginella moellendorffii]|uniref:mannose-6-phosphate isomerase 1 n=1 Tax=Selaginella moellendorffii TaxID=88036 RepID=UPI000D1CB735|nr:mannose-6-phosphate isomerase 1 [Selaginella moellendorffii]|eukprot:XP_024518728.1 mannose-6-phosphate isomerase 1 [Selaginella moellendorffii]
MAMEEGGGGGAHGGMIRLQCQVQHYEWGRIGEESEVGRLHALMTGSAVDADVPYAELWMGTHASGPSTVLRRGGAGQILLKDWLQRHPEALGDRVLERWNGDLPFLFKVLSVAKALSIQAHPDKKLAEYLHGKNPQVYKDANHKPELALALTRFGALCGFVTSQELQAALESVPELRDALGPLVVESVIRSGCGQSAKDVLRRAFTCLMTLDESVVTHTLSNLIDRLKRKSKAAGGLSPKEELVVSLEKQYPGDVGVLSAFFLNYTNLEAGQAVFLDANEPHAYLYGECVECMATSDNVVRAGLTPKFRDTQTLCSMLSYNQGPPQILDGCYVNPFTRRYSPPSDEFEVDHICVPVGGTAKISSPCGPSIFLVYRGMGVLSRVGKEDEANSIIAGLVRGNIFMLVAGTELEVSAVMDVEESYGDGEHPVQDALQLYRAGVSSRLLHQAV